MASSGRFSVIIPCYDGNATLRRAVTSVISQHRPADEIVVCDDASPTDPADALVGLEHAVHLVRRSTNGGVNAARNSALDVTTGDWIVLLDQDDEWLPDRLGAIQSAIRTAAEATDIVTTDAIVRRGGTDLHRYYDARSFPLVDQRRSIIEGNFIFAGAAVRRAALDRIGGFNADTGSEYDAWIRLVLTGSVACLVPEALAIYHLSDTQKSLDSGWTRSGITAALEWAARQPLSSDELVAATRRLGQVRAADAIVSVVEDRPGARSLAARSAMRSGAPPSLRAKLTLAAASPALARRVLRRRHRTPTAGSGHPEPDEP